MRAFLAILALSFFYAPPSSADEVYSILQGSTSDTVTHFTVVAPDNVELKFEAVVRATDKDSVKDPTQVIQPARVERLLHSGSLWAVYRLKFENLQASERYVLRTYQDGEHLVDERNFKTLIMNTGAGRIALLSCMLRQFHNPFMWNNLAKPENRPDLMLFLGDSVYLDRTRLLFGRLPTTELEVWEQFVKQRNKLNVFFWKNLVPIVSVWDDHDSGGDNVSAKYELMPKIRPIYDTFFANEEIAGTVAHGPGLAKQFEAFGKNFVMLDGRSFRDLDAQSPLFGKLQEDWMLGQIKPGANIILSGSQFYGKGLKKDSFEFNWPEQAAVFTTRLAAEGEKRDASFVFASGDIHFSQIQNLEPELFGYPTVEMTSSSVHSTIIPGYHRVLQLFRPNPRHIAGVSTHNVLLMELDSAIRSFEFKVRSLTWRGKQPFAEDITVGGPCLNYLTTKKVP